MFPIYFYNQFIYGYMQSFMVMCSHLWLYVVSYGYMVICTM